MPSGGGPAQRRFGSFSDNWKMTTGDLTWIDDSCYVVFRTWVLNHRIHHRAQLGRDVRTLACSDPRQYGPSAH
jgi:hypothetical protein